MYIRNYLLYETTQTLHGNAATLGRRLAIHSNSNKRRQANMRKDAVPHTLIYLVDIGSHGDTLQLPIKRFG